MNVLWLTLRDLGRGSRSDAQDGVLPPCVERLFPECQSPLERSRLRALLHAVEEFFRHDWTMM